jgi:hypothetical protein
MAMGNSEPLNWWRLKDDFKKKRSTVLFLGAGVDFGAPKGKSFAWDALLQHLMKYAIRRIVPLNKEGRTIIESFESKLENEDTLKLRQIFPRDVRTTIIKQTLGNESYVRLIQDFLYGEIQMSDIEEAGEQYVDYLISGEGESSNLKFYTLFRVADVILRYPNIRAVVTQNYDQFLCDAIRFLTKHPLYRYIVPTLSGDKKIRPIEPNTICGWDNFSDFTFENINIYHVHGFIPRYENIQAPSDNKIVLAMDEFYEDTRNVYSWQIASQLHFLSQYNCIFCGLSLEDLTNQRLLHYIKNKHHGNIYYLTAATKPDMESKIMDKIKNTFHENNGLTVLYDENGYPNLYKLLGELPYGKSK